MAKKLSAIGAAIVVLAGSPAHAEVTRRIDIAGSSYEKLAGTVHFAIDPTRPRNQIVVNSTRPREMLPDSSNSPQISMYFRAQQTLDC